MSKIPRNASQCQDANDAGAYMLCMGGERYYSTHGWVPANPEMIPIDQCAGVPDGDYTFGRCRGGKTVSGGAPPAQQYVINPPPTMNTPTSNQGAANNIIANNDCKWGIKYPRVPFGGCDSGYTPTGLMDCTCNSAVASSGASGGSTSGSSSAPSGAGSSGSGLDMILNNLPQLIIVMIVISLISAFRGR